MSDYGHPITFGLSLDASVELLDQTKTLAHAAEDAGMESCASQMFGGRIALGVGGGASADGVAAMGGTRRNGRDMVSHTDKALQIMRRAGRGHRSVPQRPARDRGRQFADRRPRYQRGGGTSAVVHRDVRHDQPDAGSRGAAGRFGACYDDGMGQPGIGDSQVSATLVADFRDNGG